MNRAGSGSALLGAALLAGCGGGNGSAAGTGGSATASTSGAGGGSQAIACTGQPADLALSGTWAAHGQLAVKLAGATTGPVTICPTNQEGAASLLLLITVKQNASDPTKIDQMQATLCSLELPTVTALVGSCDPMATNLVSSQIIVPQALVDALPTVATAMATGTLGGHAPGAAIMVKPLDVVLGSSKMGMGLPTWNTTSPACNMPGVGSSKTCDTTCVSDCTSLRDDDGDGYPAVTVQVCGETKMDMMTGVKCNASNPSMAGASIQGEAFVNVEVTPTFTGTVKSSCEVTGTVGTADGMVDYHVVGGNVYLGGAQIGVSDAIKSLPTFTVDTANSKFRMVRIDGQYGAPNLMVDPTQPGKACATVTTNMNQFF
jgi:hypothetical protein